LIRPPARAPPNASSVSESQCLTLFSADIKLWIPQKASSDMKNANEGIGGAACNENHTFPGMPLSLVLLRHGAHDLYNHTQYGTTSQWIQVTRNFACMFSMARSPRRRTFFALRSRDCIHVQAGPTEASAILVPRPKTGMHACTPTNLPRLEKERDVELS
jgi:hypothetical protein